MTTDPSAERLVSNAKIMVVEDEALIGLDIKARLERFGYVVGAVVTSGAAAIEKASKTNPDLILIDIQLKGWIDGIQAAQILRQVYQIPVIYLTTHEDAGTLVRAKVTEPFGYLLLPFADQQLQVQVELALTKHRVEKEALQSKKSLTRAHDELADQKRALDQFASVTETNAAGRITYVNDKFCEISGYSREELRGHTPQLLNSTYHPPAFWEEFWATIQSGGIWRGDVRNRAKDGTLFWVDMMVSPFLDSKGDACKYLAVQVVITERKRLEEELRRAKNAAEEVMRVKIEILDSLHQAPRPSVNAVLAMTEPPMSTHPTAPLVTKRCPLGPVRVLLVEDDESHPGVREQLEKLGYQPDLVAPGVHALEALESGDYHIAFMDCHWQKMERYRDIPPLRKRHGGSRNTIVVAMTGYRLEGAQEKCQAAGMDDYISKPTRIGDLKTVMDRWLAAPPTEFQVLWKPTEGEEKASIA